MSDETLTLLYAVDGGKLCINDIFSVKIGKTQPVFRLERAIKAQMPKALAHIKFLDLRLWKVSVPASNDDDFVEELAKCHPTPEDELLPVHRVNDRFPDPLEKETLNILI
ncbi:hypothetical protein EW145_g7450, partial [Phellinidium pouzarii]